MESQPFVGQHTSAAAGWLEPGGAGARGRRNPRMQRVLLEVPVRVSGSWTDGADSSGAYVPLLARSLNLSEGGMALATPVLLEEGSTVTCSLRLGDAPVYLHGHVAWRRASTRKGEPRRIGVRFSPMSDADLDPLRACLARLSQRLPVRLHFSGLPEPVFALAEAEGDDLELSAPLSLLSEGHQVELEFAENGERYAGHVKDVRMERDGDTPVLRARVGVGERDQAAFRRSVQRSNTKRAARLRRRAEHLLAGLVGFAAGAGLWWWETRAPNAIAAPVQPTGPQHAAETVDYAAATAPAAASAAHAPAAAAMRTPTAARPARAATPPAPAETMPAEPVNGQRDKRAAAFRTHDRTPTDAQPTDAQPIGPIVERLRKARQVTVPAEGTPELERVYRLIDPPGVGVHVQGRLSLPEGRYPIQRQRMLWLRVRELPEAEQTQVRLFLSDWPDTYDVEAEPDALQIRLPRE